MRLVIGVILLFACVFGLDYVIHGIFLGGDYKASLDVWRPSEGMGHLMIYMLAGQFLFALAFLLLFFRGLSPDKCKYKQGLLYGALIGLMMGSGNIIWYVVLPIPLVLGIKWFVFAVLECTILGLAAALLTKSH